MRRSTRCEGTRPGRTGRVAWAIAASLVFLLAGCPGPTYSETILATGGTVQRIVVAPGDEAWPGWSSPAAVKVNRSSRTFPRLLELEPGRGDEVTSRYTRTDRDWVPVERSILRSEARNTSWREEFRIEPLGLVRRITWTGTLSDPVAFDVMERHATIVGEMVAGLLADAVREVASPLELDAGRYALWLDGRAREWIQASCIAYYEQREAGGPADSSVWIERMARRRGSSSGADWCALTLDQFVATEVPILDATGVAFGPAQMRSFLEREIGFSPKGSPREWYDRLSESPAIRAAAEKRFPREAAPKTTFEPLLESMYALGWMGGMSDLRHRVHLPGEIVASDGVRVGDRCIEWSIDSNAAYPRQRVFHATCLVPEPSSPGASLLDERLETLQIYVACLKGDPELAKLCTSGRAGIDLAALRGYARSLEDTKGELYANAMQLIALLR
jgi:hypothetical protein